MTLVEDLSISAHFSFLTNTKIVTMKWNDLLFFKIVVLLTFVSTIILQIRIWKFKRRSTVGISMSHSNTTKKSYQKTVGKVTLRIILASISIQLFYHLMMQYEYNYNVTDSYIQNLRLGTCSQIFTMNFLPIVWIITTPNLLKVFVIKLQKVKQKCNDFCIAHPKKTQDNVHHVHFDSIVPPRHLDQEVISNSYPNTSKSTDSQKGNNFTYQKGNPIQKPSVSISSTRHITHKPVKPITLVNSHIFEQGNKNLSKYKTAGPEPFNKRHYIDEMPSVDC